MSDKNEGADIISEEVTDANSNAKLETTQVSSDCMKNLVKSSNKVYFKSLTALSPNSHLGNGKKSRRKGESKRSSGKINNGEKKSKKKLLKRKFDKCNISEVNFCPSNEDCNEAMNFLNVIGDQGFVPSIKNCVEGNESHFIDPRIENKCIEENQNIKEKPNNFDNLANSFLSKSLSDLTLIEDSQSIKLSDEDFPEVFESSPESNCGYSSGDAPQNCCFDLSSTESDETFCYGACAKNLVSKKRSVQWNGQVDVIYYAGDNNGGKILHHEIEPLREESEQQARRKKFVQLHLGSPLFGNFAPSFH